MNLKALPIALLLCFMPLVYADRPAELSDLKDCENRMQSEIADGKNERSRLWQSISSQDNEIQALTQRIIVLETNAATAQHNREWIAGIVAVLIGNIIWTYVIHQKSS